MAFWFVLIGALAAVTLGALVKKTGGVVKPGFRGRAKLVWDGDLTAERLARGEGHEFIPISPHIGMLLENPETNPWKSEDVNS